MSLRTVQNHCRPDKEQGGDQEPRLQRRRCEGHPCTNQVQGIGQVDAREPALVRDVRRERLADLERQVNETYFGEDQERRARSGPGPPPSGGRKEPERRDLGDQHARDRDGEVRAVPEPPLVVDVAPETIPAGVAAVQVVNRHRRGPRPCVPARAR